MQVGIELFSQRFKLHHTEPLEACVHDIFSHPHPLLNFNKTPLKFLKFLDLLELDLLGVVEAHLQVVPHVEEVLRELANRELSRRVDLLLVALDRVVVLGQLVDQLLLVLLHLFLETLDLLVLLGYQLLDFVDVGLREGVG